MYVARSRQKPPENAFQMRSRMKAEQEAAEASKRPLEPAVVAESMPDLDALREAAARAAALVHGEGTKTFAEAVEDAEQAARTDFNSAELEGDTDTDEPPQGSRGRPQSSAVAERTARVLTLVSDSGTAGVTKAALVRSTGESPTNVNTSLQKLKDDGKVDSRPVEGSKALAWFAV